MIRIAKSSEWPTVLLEKGKDATLAFCSAYDTDPEAYQSLKGKPVKDIQKFEFDSDIYGHDSVKSRLIADQFEKCCYCEALFRANGYGDVEHFRPKACYLTLEGKTLVYPGYYWLAYD